MSLVYYFFETQCINQVLQFCLLTLFQIRCIPECNILIRIVWRLWQLRAHKNLPFHVKWLSRHAGVGRFSERNFQALSMVCVTLEDITTSCTKTDHWNNAECASSARELWIAGICCHRRSLMLHHWMSSRTDWTNSWTAMSWAIKADCLGGAENAGQDIAGQDNDGQTSMAWLCRTGQWRTRELSTMPE